MCSAQIKRELLTYVKMQKCFIPNKKVMEWRVLGISSFLPFLTIIITIFATSRGGKEYSTGVKRRGWFFIKGLIFGPGFVLDSFGCPVGMCWRKFCVFMSGWKTVNIFWRGRHTKSRIFMCAADHNIKCFKCSFIHSFTGCGLLAFFALLFLLWSSFSFPF